MLDRTERKLRSYAFNEPQMCIDGKFREIDNITSVDRAELNRLISLIDQIKPDVSVETGMAYGSSTIAILDFMESSGHGHHIAIDPRQRDAWYGIGLTSVGQLGFEHRFTLIEERSDQAFTMLVREGKRVQFVFLDGVQYFDGIITDFVLASQILDVGGVIVFNQLWMPGGRAAGSFITNNSTNFIALPVESDQFFAFQKTGDESRPWDHFVPFDGSGRQNVPVRKQGLFRKLFG